MFKYTILIIAFSSCLLHAQEAITNKVENKPAILFSLKKLVIKGNKRKTGSASLYALYSLAGLATTGIAGYAFHKLHKEESYNLEGISKRLFAVIVATVGLHSAYNSIKQSYKYIQETQK